MPGARLTPAINLSLCTEILYYVGPKEFTLNLTREKLMTAAKAFVLFS